MMYIETNRLEDVSAKMKSIIRKVISKRKMSIYAIQKEQTNDL